jgi:hypothetical protein
MADRITKFDSARLRHLLSEHFNEVMNSRDQAELEEMLTSFPAAREMYWQYMEVHAGLIWKHNGKIPVDRQDSWAASVPINYELEPPDTGDQKKRVPSRSVSLLPYGMVAAILAIAVGAILSNFAVRRNDSGEENLAQPSPRQAQRLESNIKGLVLGTIRPLLEASHWSFGKPGERNRTSFLAGDTLWLDSGAVELRLANNTAAKLESPAIVQVLSLNRARVLKGRITVDVAKGAEGFAIETASAEIVDLGTVFSVDVNDSATDVIVFEGKVDLKLAKLSKSAQGFPASEQLAPEVRRMNMGEAIRILDDGTLSRIAHVSQTDFLGRRIPIISAVRDNVRRVDMLKFYEIVPGGMQEDAQSFADRLHQWNGVDADGMPSYLVGGDYVKTFNDDKVVDELEIALTLDQPSMVYILMDTRTPPPPWLTSSFEDTGDVIGVDEKSPAPFEGIKGTKYYLAKGSGSSVDKIHSIWRREVHEPGDVILGPNGLLLEQTKEAGTSAGVNMYGIVVVPLAEDGDL